MEIIFAIWKIFLKFDGIATASEIYFNNFKVADVEEIIPENASPDEVVKSLAMQKAQAVAKDNPDSIVIGSDTVVALGNTILGKPKDEENAVEMLKMLSGRSHTVYTGVALVHGEKTANFCEATEVVFNSLTDEEIRDYVATNEPMDKAQEG